MYGVIFRILLLIRLINRLGMRMLWGRVGMGVGVGVWMGRGLCGVMIVGFLRILGCIARRKISILGLLWSGTKILQKTLIKTNKMIITQHQNYKEILKHSINSLTLKSYQIKKQYSNVRQATCWKFFPCSKMRICSQLKEMWWF